MKLLWDLFFGFFQVGLLSFGGGLAAMPLISEQAVERYGWLTMTQFTDLVTLSEMTPGPIAVNAATFVGQRMAGIAGAITATLGAVLPGIAVALALAALYRAAKESRIVSGALAGLRPCVVALIGAAGLRILMNAVAPETGFDYVALALFLAGLFARRKWRANLILVMLASGAVGGGIYFLMG